MNTAAIHVAIQANITHQRNIALLYFADRLIGSLNEELVRQLGIQTSARTLTMSAAAHHHAVARRQVSSQIDAELVASRISEAASNLQYQLLPQRVENVFELVGKVSSADKWLVLPIKLVRASGISKEDKWWVRTCYPYGRKNIAKAQRKGLLRKLSHGAV
ncbi:MAG: hypothetical protein QM808_11540 [Steroidobacteraceae bacterium]